MSETNEQKLTEVFTKVANADGWQREPSGNLVRKYFNHPLSVNKIYDFDSECLIYKYNEAISVVPFSALSSRGLQEAEVLRQRFCPDLPPVGQSYPHEAVEAVTKKINPSYSSGPM